MQDASCIAILLKFSPPSPSHRAICPRWGITSSDGEHYIMLILLRTMLEVFGTAAGRSFPSWDVALDLSRRRGPKIRRGQFIDSELGIQSRMFCSIKEMFRALKTPPSVSPPWSRQRYIFRRNRCFRYPFVENPQIRLALLQPKSLYFVSVQLRSKAVLMVTLFS